MDGEESDHSQRQTAHACFLSFVAVSFQYSDICASFGIPTCQKINKGPWGRGVFKGKEIEYTVILG